MIYCKCNCIHAKHGKCEKEDVVINQLGCLNYDAKDDDVYDRVLDYYGYAEQTKKVLEELLELSIEIIDNSDKIADEIADVYNMLEQLKLIYNFDNESIAIVMERKMERTMERIRLEKEY